MPEESISPKNPQDSCGVTVYFSLRLHQPEELRVLAQWDGRTIRVAGTQQRARDSPTQTTVLRDAVPNRLPILLPTRKPSISR